MSFFAIALSALLEIAGSDASIYKAQPLDNFAASVDEKAEEAMDRLNQQAFERWLEKSTSPRDWALASLLLQALNHDDRAATLKAKALLDKATDAAPNDRLVLWLWSVQSTDDSACVSRSVCTKRVFALKMLEPGNGEALAWDVTNAWAQHDVHVVDAALAHMAHASHYDDSFGSTFRAWEDALQRYPRARFSTPMTEGVSIDVQGRSIPLAQWTTRTMDDIDHSLAGAAAVLVVSEPMFSHYQFARACDRKANPTASPKRFEHCATIGRMLLNHSSFFLGRNEGALILLSSNTANDIDVATARALHWQMERFFHLGLDRNAEALAGYLKAYDATNSEVEAAQQALQQGGIPLTPPRTWKWIRNGKETNPLGEWHPSPERR